MSWINDVFNRAAELAGVAFVILAAGALLTSCWRRPIEKLRCIQATFIALIVGACLHQVHLLPQVALGWLPGNHRTEVDAGRAGAKGDEVEVASLPARSMQIDSKDSELRADRSARLATPIGPPIAAVTSHRAGPIEAQPHERWSVAEIWKGAFLSVFLVGGCCSLLYLGVGVIRLRRLRRTCLPAPAEIAELVVNMQGRRPDPVTVLTSFEIEVPVTTGAWRPVIILPMSLVQTGSSLAVRNCLAHEMSHVRRHDVAQWWAVQALQPFFWIQPLYWVLRRQLRLVQDQVADAFASDFASDSTSYAELLVTMAKAHRRCGTCMVLAMSDGRSNLYRRIQTLLSGDHRMAAVCRWRVIYAAAALMIALTGASSVFDPECAEATEGQGGTVVRKGSQAPAKDSQSNNLNKATAEKPESSKTDNPNSVLGIEQSDGSLLYSGEVVDKMTKAPISGAEVTVRRMISSSFDRKIIEETKHTTDEHGQYSFVIPPKQVAERFLYIELDVAHPNYASKANFGYALSMIRKNAKLNDPPFFSHVELDPGAALTGKIVGPDGKPLADVPLLAYSNINPRDFSNDNYGSFFHAKSAADGTFRLSLTKDGPSVFWIVPEGFAPRQIVSGTKRGDWGDVQMAAGVALKGQVLDATGKPVAGVWVNATDEESQREIQMPVGTSLTRSGQSDADGRFELRPLKPGKYRLVVEDYPEEIRFHSRDHQRHEIPVVFLRRTITIGANSQEPIIVRAVPHVQIEGQYFDSKGKHRTGHEIFVHGKIDGDYYFGQIGANADGQIKGIVPHGLEKAQIQLMANEHGALRIRLGKDKPLIHGRDIDLGTLESDITGIEIVHYTAPIVLVTPVDEDGKPVAKVKVGAVYEAEDKDKLIRPVDGLPTNIFFEKQPKGIFRSSQLLPDEKTKFIASAEGYEEAHETLSLPEGETRELKLVLKRSPSKSETKSSSGAKESSK